MNKFIFIFTFIVSLFSIRVEAGFLSSKPPASFKSKLMTIPMLNSGKPIDLTIEEFEKFGFREGVKLSWDNDGKATWILEIKFVDKMRGKSDVMKLRFQDEPKTARLDRIVVNGKEENINFSPQLLGAILVGAQKTRGPSPRQSPVNQVESSADGT